MRIRIGQAIERQPVSSGDPCPFLRALVADGTLSDGQEPLGHIAKTLAGEAKKGVGAPTLPKAGINGITVLTNGFSPFKFCTISSMVCNSMCCAMALLTDRARGHASSIRWGKLT